MAVPADLLLDRALAPSAKLIWMVYQLEALSGPVGPTLVGRRSGLSQPTIRTGLAGLADAGWTPGVDPASGATVMVPDDLLTDSRLGIPTRVLYGALQLTPGFRWQRGRVTYAAFGSLIGLSPNTVKLAFRELVQTGWLRFTQAHRLAPICFSLRRPRYAGHAAEVPRARGRVISARHTGEALMWEYLSLLIDSDQFADNAFPGFLVNPRTGARLQYDRYYPKLALAFEFNGAQHDHETEKFSAAEVAEQQERDLLKVGISVREMIRLVVVHAEDLSLKGMQQKVGGGLPLRDLAGHESLIRYLDAESKRYRKGPWAPLPRKS